MLPHYSPYKVAECFSVAAGLAPGRIDLGLGRATGSDAIAALALQRGRRSRIGSADFAEQVDELQAYLGSADLLAADHPFANLRKHLPHGGSPPTLWMLGTSQDSARLAGTRGLPYAIADFINPRGAVLAQVYRDCFEPGPDLAEPYVIVASPAICAPERSRAAELRLPFLMQLARLFRGEVVSLPTIAEAKEWLEGSPSDIGSIMRVTVGDPTEIRVGLLSVVNEYGADELMIVNIVPEREARIESYSLLIQAFSEVGGPQ